MKRVPGRFSLLLMAGVMCAAANVSPSAGQAAPAETPSKTQTGPESQSCRPPDFPLPAFPSASFNVRDFGASGDGKTPDTAAINRAIERCNSRGGGTVLFPPGTYVSATIHLLSHVRLEIRQGAIIQSAPSGFDLAEPNPNSRYQDGGHSHFHNALFRGENIEDCAVTGGGEINGKSLALFDPKQPDAGDKMFSIVSGRNIQFDNIRLKNGGHFAWLLNDCENVTISGVTLRGSRDAIDLMGCRNVQIHGCNFSSCIDDTLGIKSDWALGRKIETRNVYAWDCDFDSGCNALQFGSETAGDFHNVNLWDIRIHRAEKAGIGITTNDGGDIDGVTCRHITMTGVANPVFILVTDRLRSGDPAKRKGRIRNVLLSSITVTDCRSGPHHGGVHPITLSGRPESHLKNITLEDITVTYPGGGLAATADAVPAYGKEYAPGKFGDRPAAGLYARNIDGLTLRRVSFAFAAQDGRPVLAFADINGLSVEGFRSTQPDGGPLLRMDRVSECTILDSPGLANCRSVAVDRKLE
jgi:polygalacturonase